MCIFTVCVTEHGVGRVCYSDYMTAAAHFEESFVVFTVNDSKCIPCYAFLR